MADSPMEADSDDSSTQLPEHFALPRSNRNQSILFVSLDDVMAKPHADSEFPLVYAIHSDDENLQNDLPEQESEPEVDPGDNVIDRPMLEDNNLVALPGNNDDSENDSVQSEDTDPLAAILDLNKLLAFNEREDYRRYDFPDTDPVLNALEGDQSDDGLAGVASTDDQQIVENLPDDDTGGQEALDLVPNIHIYTNSRIEAFIRLYTERKRDVFELAIQRSARYLGMIHRIFREYKLPPNLAYLAIVESNFNPNARSRANAVGLWQFMSYTGKIFDLSRSWWHDDRYDPEKSTIAAAKYLKHLHQRFNGNWELAMAAYNSGGGTVRRAIRRAKRNDKPTDYWSLRLPRETRGYVPAYYAVANIFKNLEKYGFDPAPPAIEEPEKQSLTVSGGISLRQIANVLGLEDELLEKMNPCLRLRGLTPASMDHFEISIPKDVEVTDEDAKELAQLAVDRKEDWKIHRVVQGETLWSISRYYHIPISKILAFNHLRRKNLINIGQKLLLPVPKTWSPPPKQDVTKVVKNALDKLPGITYIHVVKKGETLWRISTMYNIPIEDIRKWNRKLLSHRYLKVGAEIVLKLPVTLENST